MISTNKNQKNEKSKKLKNPPNYSLNPFNPSGGGQHVFLNIDFLSL
jgi:hypothetical protein